jgi:hypothetical protein
MIHFKSNVVNEVSTHPYIVFSKAFQLVPNAPSAIIILYLSKK